jgi:N-acetylglutamate synthase-like GNAT family acetyltransferase
MKARRAKASDVRAIYELIAHFVEEGLLLPRAEEEIRANVSHFFVLEDEERVAGCVALESYTADLAEVRSLAVAPDLRSRGLGARLLRFAVAQARRRRIARVFAVTHAPEFFVRHGFAVGVRQSLTEKIERDCRTCKKRRSCKLIAVIATVIPRQAALAILDDSAVPAAVA